MPKPAYFIIDVKVHNPEGMKPYSERVAETYKPYGGKLLVYRGEAERLEGGAPSGIMVILQFESIEKARTWHESPEYQAILKYREASAESNAYLVEGLEI